MWYEFVIPIAMALGITLIHFLGEKISEHLQKLHYHLQSFGAGLMVGVIFLELLPHIATGQEHLDEFIYLPFLFGFTIMALVEKFIYRKLIRDLSKPKLEIEGEVLVLETNSQKSLIESEIIDDVDPLVDCTLVQQNALFEGIAFISHGVVIGLLIALIFETYQTIAYIVLIPFFIRAFTLSFSTEQFLEEMTGRKVKVIRILSMIAPTFGAAIGLFMVLNKILLYTFFALTLGLILYVVIRDMIPLGKKGKPLYFLGGVILAVSIFLMFEFLINS